MWTVSKFYNEYVPGLETVMVDTYHTVRKESMWDQMCTVKTSKKAYEEDVIRSRLSSPQVKGEGAPITFDTQIAGPKQTYVPVVYALGVKITEEAVSNCLYELGGGGETPKLRELYEDLGLSLAEWPEIYMARFLNNAAATTYHTDRFGDALASTAHDRLDGTTFSNYSTNADLTYTAFWSIIVAAENQYDHRQNRIFRKVKNLWIPPQLEMKAIEILKSTDRPDVANRATNAYAKSGRNIGLKVWRYLTDVDAHYYQMEGEGIKFYWRRKTRFGRDTEFLTGDYMVKGDQWFGAEIADCQGFYCNIPA